jgi:hypothetical protein
MYLITILLKEVSGISGIRSFINSYIEFSGNHFCVTQKKIKKKNQEKKIIWQHCCRISNKVGGKRQRSNTLRKNIFSIAFWLNS